MTGILIDQETGDLLIERGGIAIGETEEQTAEAVLVSMRGEFKEFPQLGGEAVRQLGGGVDVMWTGRVKKMLRGCGVDVSTVTVSGANITIE